MSSCVSCQDANPSIGSRKHAKWAKVFARSNELHEAVASLRQMIFTLHPSEWVASYLLLCLSHVFPKGFIGGKLAIDVKGSAESFPSSQVWAKNDSESESVECKVNVPTVADGQLKLSEVHGLVLAPSDVKKIGGTSVSVLHVFRNFQLSCIPIFVNECITHWAAGLRPLVLMERVASPKELMVMQSEGRRCVTCFCRSDELGREFEDSYPPHACKDTLHFAIHDLQHMEKFVEPAYYCEQVGFLHQMRAVHAWLSKGGCAIADREFRADVSHVISDMNTCCSHLLRVLLQKVYCCGRRWATAQEGEQASIDCIEEAALPDAVQQALITILDLLQSTPGSDYVNGMSDIWWHDMGRPPPPENAFDVAAVRQFFRVVGCVQLVAALSERQSDVVAGAKTMEELWPAMLSSKEL
eukprot:TRINITY_DN25109_c0_g1_i1.p1 TRINITY_DN25109_c0_g1~~TRINITY_DN25109_c0_g1_i1.p1  ORF type:complete len:426 (+),score=51.74 TRINITY_DN25109_c0_g1_i1:44-1279(+)